MCYTYITTSSLGLDVKPDLRKYFNNKLFSTFLVKNPNKKNMEEFKKQEGYNPKQEAQDWFDEMLNQDIEPKKDNKEEEKEEDATEDMPFNKHPKFKAIKEQAKKAKQLEEELEQIKKQLNQREYSNEEDVYDDPLYNNFHKLYFNGENEDAVKQAWIEQSKINNALIEKAKKEFEKELLEKEREIQEEEDRYTSEIQDNLERIEKEFKLDIDNPKIKRDILTIYEKLSPKDNNGNIIALADIETVAEYYTLKNKSVTDPKTEAKKQVASDSMRKQPTGENIDTKKPVTINSSWRDFLKI